MFLSVALFALEYRFRVEEMVASGPHPPELMLDTWSEATPAETVLGQVSHKKLLVKVGNIWEWEMSVLRCSFKSSVLCTLLVLGFLMEVGF